MANTSSSVLDRLSRRSAFSEARRSYLETFANLLVTADIDVEFQSMDNPAACAPHEDGDGFDVLIDDKKFVDRCGSTNKTPPTVQSGPLSDVPKGYIDAFLQEGLLYHELGHVLFTDFEALNDALREVTMSNRSDLHEFLNVYEDAVIEVFLREMFDCGTQLLVKNRVFHELYHADQRMWEKPFACESSTLATLPGYELGRYDTGVLDKFESLADSATQSARRQKEAVDAGIECFYDVVQMPDPGERYERIVELFKEVWSETSGQKARDELEEMNEPEADTDASRSDGQQMSAPDISPETEEDEDEDGEAGAGDGGVESESNEESDSVGAGESDDEESESSSSDSLVDDLDEEDVEELEEDTELNPDDGEESRAEDIEGEIEKVSGSGGHSSVEIGDPDDFDASSSRVRAAERRAHHLESVVRKHFRERQGDAERTGLTSGRFDSRQMISAARGSPRVFKQQDDPDEPDFQVVVAVDVSGSMQTCDRIDHATSVATTVTKAFEDAGGQSWVVRFGTTSKIVKTPSMRYDETKDAIAEASTSGSTNLLPLLDEYEEITESARNSFLFVVTDGRPHAQASCMEELDSLDDPTAVLQISSDGYDGWHDHCDAFAVVEDSEIEELPDKAESLVRRLVETRGTAI